MNGMTLYPYLFGLYMTGHIYAFMTLPDHVGSQMSFALSMRDSCWIKSLVAKRIH